MKFHAFSFLLGVAVTAAGIAGKQRLRPVVVELGALGVHLGRVGRAVVAREIEQVEDLWEEIQDRVRARGSAARAPTPAARVSHVNGQA